jgi:hypothetical protein
MMVVASEASGWIGLLGVVAGGVITAGFTVLLERSRRRRDAAMARRLAAADLQKAELALADAMANRQRAGDPLPSDPAQDQQWPIGWERETWAQSWAGYRSALATSMRDDEFRVLAAAFGYIGQLQNALAAGRRPFEGDDSTFLSKVSSAVSDARSTLGSGPS